VEVLNQAYVLPTILNLKKYCELGIGQTPRATIY
jgi:hypothetical protein